jgi:hypothetical protein
MSLKPTILDICHCHRCGGDWLKAELLDTGACPACPNYTDIHASISVPVLPRDVQSAKMRLQRIRDRLTYGGHVYAEAAQPSPSASAAWADVADPDAWLRDVRGVP